MALFRGMGGEWACDPKTSCQKVKIFFWCAANRVVCGNCLVEWLRRTLGLVVSCVRKILQSRGLWWQRLGCGITGVFWGPLLLFQNGSSLKAQIVILKTSWSLHSADITEVEHISLRRLAVKLPYLPHVRFLDVVQLWGIKCKIWFILHPRIARLVWNHHSAS